MTVPEQSELARFGLRDADGIGVATISGEIDISNASSIEARLRRLPERNLGLVIDLNETSFIDSSAVSLLFSMRHRLRMRGQPVHVVAGDASAARRILELTGFDREQPLASSVEDALAAIRSTVSP